jgi:WD40 repeat protein
MIYWYGGRYIITRDRFGFFKQWSYEKKEMIQDWSKLEPEVVECLAMSPDCSSIVYTVNNNTTGCSRIKVWQLSDPNRGMDVTLGVHLNKKISDIAYLHTIEETHDCVIVSLIISWNGLHIFTADGAGVVKQWGLYGGDLKLDWGEVHSSGIYAMSINVRNTRMYLGGADGLLREYSVINQTFLHDFGKVHDDRIILIKINRKGTMLFTASEDLH